MRGGYGIPWDISGRIDNALNVECGKAALVRDRKLRDCAVRLRVLSAKRCLSTDTNSTHQNPRNTDSVYIAATEQFRTSPVLRSHSHPIPSQRPHSFPACDMTDQPGSVRFQAPLESAVQAYEKKAGVTLADLEDSLAMRLQRCHSVDDIATLLQGQAQAIDDFQQRDRIFKSIKTTVSILSPTYSAASGPNP